MRAIFRSPWWEVLLGALFQPGIGAGCGSGGFVTCLAALGVMLLICGAFAAFAWAHWGLLELVHGLRRWRAGLRFLCPECLCFSPPRYACPSCGTEVEGFVIRTRGLYVNDCPRCKAAIFPRHGRRGRGVAAYCRGCGRVAPAHYHERRVRLLGAFGEADLASFCNSTPGTWTRRNHCSIRDDGGCLVYVLDVEALASRGPMPRGHAVRRIETLWLDRAAGEPLALGKALDRFLRSGVRKPVVRSPRSDLEPASRRLVESRLGRVRRALRLMSESQA